MKEMKVTASSGNHGAVAITRRKVDGEMRILIDVEWDVEPSAADLDDVRDALLEFAEARSGVGIASYAETIQNDAAERGALASKFLGLDQN